MGKRGPAPKPTALKKLQGNPGKRSLPAGEPQPHVGSRTPSVPAWLDEEAKKIWQRYARTMWELRLLTEIDVEAFAALCESMALYQTAVEKIREEGAVQRSTSGYTQKSGWMTVRDSALSDMRSLWKEFGMTPSARAGMNLAPEEEEDDIATFLARAVAQAHMEGEE